MSISNATLGAQTSADVYYYSVGGSTPLIVSKPVSYVVRSPNNLLIASGIATQDINNAAHWTCQFTIPTTAPATQDGQFYTLLFMATAGASNFNQTFNFTVASNVTLDPIDPAIVVLQNNPFGITIPLPYSSLSSLSLRLVDVNNNVIVTPDVTSTNIATPQAYGNQWIYSLNIDSDDSSLLTTASSGAFPYFAYINYTTNVGVQGTTIPVVYIVTGYVLSLMNSIRRYVDRLRNNDAIPQLRITDIDLIHFAYKGLEWVNMQPPSNFVFSLGSLSTQGANRFSMYVEKAACLNLLESLYLGYGMSNFQFQGQAVQLEHDPTQYIQTMCQDLRTDLSTVGVAKNHFARSGGFSGGLIGTSGGVFGPVSNIVFQVSPGGFNAGYPILPFLG